MKNPPTLKVSEIPAVYEVMESDIFRKCIADFGREATIAAVRREIDAMRDRLRMGEASPASRTDAVEEISKKVGASLENANTLKIRRVFNLTGTVLHTNLGRAAYAEKAVQTATNAMRYPLTLEYDLKTGRRGQRDDPVQDLVCEIIGAEAACIVNNNASAVLLVLAALSHGRETIVSRGELIEIGGSFRMPDIMKSAGTRLREVGTTNRTHIRDYADAIGPDTGLLMKVHTSNYRIMGFTNEVTAAALAALAHEKGVPFVDDLGSGVLVDLAKYGLKGERTVQEALSDGVDLVTFSGDKLLGGPQAGIIAGQRELVAKCARHPVKRAVRLDKVRLAALEATLMLYRTPVDLSENLPSLRYLSRTPLELRELATSLLPAFKCALPRHQIEVVDSEAQIGSGAMPLEMIPSIALRITGQEKHAGSLAALFRQLPIPVIGRVSNDALLLDMRCLDDPRALTAQVALL